MAPHCFRDNLWSLTGAAHIPEFVEWVYMGGIQECAISPARLPDEDEQADITVFTDKDITSPFVDETKSKHKIAFLNECRSIHPFAYQWITGVEDKFDYIFTHDAQLLERGGKYVKNILGTTWINNDSAAVFKKEKLVSHIVSTTRWARGHNLRHIVAEAIRRGNHNVDIWGSAYRGFESKLEPLKDYCFSITIMNASHKNYFTETLVDTFRCGTVPIFWGCENIEDFFNEKGILRFTTGPELMEILGDLSVDRYREMLPYVEENFELAKNYLNVDDSLAKNIVNKLGIK